ncbi:hypothetical protein [Rhodopirellula sallentina]|uniref:Uncharacterized protein n=1 Tax=Rhodopirellula sallentina SM41 TaxID=1263870 RepID=M5UDC1_9BACT|nr:hypothetical protein [Rhodopirellula sallentina]EMI55851.1 hypothetical protein RSSM_02714 [Rhodopirellula sallentina SM41]
MRLTLRTLLAYLDDMLEEEDTETLKAKIEESGIATSLIARIRNSVDRREIGALSPDAIGPLENANVMSEYLDSTLSQEQIAEIERLCLESDTSLSEAAACHQILTVVLGQPARVSEKLRNRIYDLPLSDELRLMEQQTKPAADAGTSQTPTSATTAAFSSVEIPAASDDAELDLGSGPDAVTSELSGVATGSPQDWSSAAATVIRPVGPDDSGVSDASARIRKQSDIDEDAGRSEAEIVAGATRAMLERTDGYGGAIRPSRITPWLVTLALAGVVLYVLGQIFAPLTKQNLREIGAVAVEDNEPVVLPSLPAVDPDDTAKASVPPETDSAPTASDAMESPTTEGDPAADSDTEPAPETTSVAPSAGTPDSEVVEAPAETTDGMPDSDVDPTASTEPPASEPATAPETSPPEQTDATDNSSEMPVVEEVSSDSEAQDDASDAEAAVVAPVPTGEAAIVAQLAIPNSLVIVRNGDNWARLTTPPADADADAPPATPKESSTTTSVIRAGQVVVAPALFRPILNNQTGLEWTLAGPTRLRLGEDEQIGSVTHVIDGRLLLASTQPDVSATLLLGARQIRVAMPEAQTVLAVELTHLRRLGSNPLAPNTRLPVYRIIAVQGNVMVQSSVMANSEVTSTDDTVTLETRQQLQGSGVQPAALTTVDRLPSWIDAPAKRDVLVESAQEGLRQFVGNDEPIEKALREAMAFRRVEVPALAAETLLLLGRADVYFGTDGILHRPRQRLYWEEHFNMLRQQIASDAQTAEAIRVAIERAELADSQNLYKLLVGFTPEELENGGDAKLVEFLDSSSMAVRVLAIENLRLIVGDTLGYRADQENANSRRGDIKKWETRLRRGDIRYGE